MDQRQRIAMQRMLAHEAMAKLRAIKELFGVDGPAQAGASQQKEFLEWEEGVDAFEQWVWDKSPIA